MKNLKLKFAGSHINVVTYLVVDENSEGQFASVKKGYLPTDSQGNNVPYQEIMEQVDCISEYTDKSTTFVLKDGSTFEIEMSERMGKQVGRLNCNGFSLIESYFRIFTKLEEPVVTKEEFDAKQKAEKSAATPAKAAPRKTKKSAITDTDLDYIMTQIEANFPNGTKFKNKDLAPLVEDRFTARQTPSRLKKLADAGKLECDTASPKNYWISE